MSHVQSARVRRPRSALCPGVAFSTLVLLFASPLPAQTDYYNTSSGRPLRIEDALPVEFRAVELDLTPVRWEAARNATYRWLLEPEIAVGVLPRTQLQVGVPLALTDRRSSSAGGATGLEISVMHALNAETSIPALAVSGDVLIPMGGLAADAPYATLKAIMTRTLRVARIHRERADDGGAVCHRRGHRRRRRCRDVADGSPASRWTRRFRCVRCCSASRRSRSSRLGEDSTRRMERWCRRASAIVPSMGIRRRSGSRA